jgi:hypothetical protein
MFIRDVFVRDVLIKDVFIKEVKGKEVKGKIEKQIIFLLSFSFRNIIIFTLEVFSGELLFLDFYL